MAILNADSIAGFCSGFAATVKSAVKILLAGNPGKFPVADTAEPLYILGNGPSLRDNISNDLELLRHGRTLAVNFAANAPEFTLLRPTYYVLADPHFFNNPGDPNVSRLIDALASAEWEMTLFVPVKARIPASLNGNPRLSVVRFRFIAAEGFTSFEHFAFRHRLGMPRPRNVLIPSIMIGLWMGYKKIYLLGADHSWLKTLSVDDENRVVSIQPHFYTEDDREQQRIRKTYMNLPLHSVLESFHIAFRSYHRIRHYADSCGAEVINATPGSFIDAFSRGSLPSHPGE